MRGRKTREYILKKAADLFYHFGFYKTAMDDIADEARVGKGTLYYYFKSKYDLFSAVLMHEAKKLMEGVRNIISEQDDPEEKILKASIAHIRELRRNPLIQETLLDEKLLEIPDISKAVEKIKKLFTEFFRDLIDTTRKVSEKERISSILVDLILSVALLPSHLSGLDEENFSLIVRSILRGGENEG